MLLYADMKKVEILPQTIFWSSNFSQNSMIRNQLTLFRAGGGRSGTHPHYP